MIKKRFFFYSPRGGGAPDEQEEVVRESAEGDNIRIFLTGFKGRGALS